ncbi:MULTISPECIES: ion channel [unclassified Lysinibacillus]
MNSTFLGCNFKNSNLTLAKFNNSNLEGANLKGARISDVRFNNAKLGYVKYDNKTDFHNIDKESFNGSSNPLFIDFINKKHFLKHFKSKSKSNKVVYYIWYLISDCGQSFSRWFLVSGIISIIYSLLFTFFNSSFLISSGRELTPFSYFYFSIVTFTTLGYGDITPKDRRNINFNRSNIRLHNVRWTIEYLFRKVYTKKIS